MLSSSRQPFVKVGGGVGFFVITDMVETATTASHEPTVLFRSQFLGYSLEQVHEVFAVTLGTGDSRSQVWSQHTFLMLDSSTLSDPPTALVVTTISGQLETIRSDLPTTLRMVAIFESQNICMAYAEARLVRSGFVSAAQWEQWQSIKIEPVRIELDKYGDRWFELIDDSLDGLGLVRREDETAKWFTQWRRKETVEGGLVMEPPIMVNTM